MAKTATNADGTKRNRTDQLARRVYAVEQTPPDGGYLNPQFAETLMIWPKDWTKIDPLPEANLDAWRLAFYRESPESIASEMVNLPLSPRQRSLF